MKRTKEKNKFEKIKKVALFFFIFFIFIFSLYLINKITINNRIIEGYKENTEVKIHKSLLPIRNWKIESPHIEARSAVVSYIDSENNKKFVFEKNKELLVKKAYLLPSSNEKNLFFALLPLSDIYRDLIESRLIIYKK